jgi:hypothetical protein
VSRRPEWARRDWRPAIMIGSAGAFGGLVIGLCVLMIILEAAQR